jgi:hypothetical protein
MSAKAGSETDQPRRYWKAAIATLPPEKRDVAWEFYVNHLAEGRTGDTLSALILLLEANGIFLLTLPEKFHSELIRPLTERFSALRVELLDHFERQQKALVEFDKVEEAMKSASGSIFNTRIELLSRISTAVENVDVAGITNRINLALQSETLKPLQKALRDLDDHAKNLQQATHAAEQSVETWRRVHIRGIVLVAALVSLVFAAAVLCWGWWRMENQYRARLAAQVVRLSGTDDAYRQLLWLGITIRLSTWENPSGRRVKNGYVISIDDAEIASLKSDGDSKKAIVMLKAQPLVEQLKSSIDELNHLKVDPSLEQRK